MYQLRHEHAVKTLCRVLQVNRSTYYKHFYTKAAPRTIENRNLRKKILTLYAASDKRLGVRKMRKRLEVEYGIKISTGRVYRLMRGMQLPRMATEKKPVLRKKVKQAEGECENLLKQQFNPKEPNQVWASDITYIKTGKGFCYLCVVLDLYSRKVVGWKVGKRINSQFVIAAVEDALLKRERPAGLLFHSDRGSQYTSKQFRDYADRNGILQSFSAPGYPYDNAVVESFFKFMKKEELKRRHFENEEEVKMSAMSYIEGYYNPRRPHGANDMLSPDEKEAQFGGQSL